MAAKLTTEQNEAIRKAYDDGLTVPEASDETGVKLVAIRNRYKEWDREKDTNVTIDPRTLVAHEVCELFRSLPDDELDAMTESIRADGLLCPIWTWRGRVIDGRHRVKACCNAGHMLGPGDIREYDGDEAGMYRLVETINERRRHETPGERLEAGVRFKRAREARIAEELRQEYAAGPLPKSSKPHRDAAGDAAKLVGLGRTTIVDADRVAKASPEKFREVIKGKTTLQQAKRDLGLDRRSMVRKDGTPLVDVRDCPNPTRLADVQQDHEERAAIRDDASDEVWVTTLPCYHALPEGRIRDAFAKAAIRARRFHEFRRTIGAKLAELKVSAKSPEPYFYHFIKGMECAPPDQWYACPALDKGGCAGQGTIGFGTEVVQCNECRGRGYRVS